MEQRSTQNSLALVGGYGKMGVWILEFLHGQGLLDKMSVVITGPRKEPGEKVARRFGCSYSSDNLTAARSRYVVICTPIKIAPSIICQIGPLMEKGSVLMDICSVKTEVCSVADKSLPPAVEYVSVHPMFGPSVKNLEGQVVIIIPVRGDNFAPRLQAFLERSKARTIVTTSEMHDYALAVVQSLTHFAYLAVGTTLKDLDFDIRDSRALSSPVYELMLDMIGRILSGDPGMYGEIQMSNPYSAKVEELFLANAQRLKAAVDARDATAFSKMMLEAARHYDDLDSAFSKSSRAVSALYEELLKIKASVGKRVAIRNEVTGAVHIGLLKDMTPESLTMGDGRRVTRLKTANASLLSEEETGRQRISKFGTSQRDASFTFDRNADPQVVAAMVQAYDRELASISPIDVYVGPGIPEGKKSITFRFVFFGDLDADEAEKRARGLFRALGAGER